MRYEVLGPLRVGDGNLRTHVSAPKIATLFATMLVRADQVVTYDQLIEEIWGQASPRRALSGLHVYISQIRKLLGSLGGSGDAIVTCPSGYVFPSEGADLDYRHFVRLAERATVLARNGEDGLACDVLEEALGLWRGDALADLPSGPIIGGCVVWLTEMRVDCLEMLIDCRLNLGRHRENVGRLYALTRQYPLREAFYRQLMLALYRADRQAEALGVYQTARRVLHEELGLEPCRALQETQRAILTADARPRHSRPLADALGPARQW